MLEVVCALLLRSGDKSDKSTLWYARTGRSVLTALAVLTVFNLLTHPALAQDSHRTSLRHTQASRPLPPEIMAMHTLAKRPTAASPAGSDLTIAAATTATSTTFNSDQGPGPGPIGPGPGCNLFPAPPSVGATVPLSYFGPPPSDVNQSFVGPVQLLRSGTEKDIRAVETIYNRDHVPMAVEKLVDQSMVRRGTTSPVLPSWSLGASVTRSPCFLSNGTSATEKTIDGTFPPYTTRRLDAQESSTEPEP